MKRKLSILLLSALIVGAMAAAAAANTDTNLSPQYDGDTYKGEYLGSSTSDLGTFTLSIDRPINFVIRYQSSSAYASADWSASTITTGYGLELDKTSGDLIIKGTPTKRTGSGTVIVSPKYKLHNRGDSGSLGKITFKIEAMAMSPDKYMGSSGQISNVNTTTAMGIYSQDADSTPAFIAGWKSGSSLDVPGTQIKFTGASNGFNVSSKISPSGSGLNFVLEPIQTLGPTSRSVIGSLQGTVPVATKAFGKEGDGSNPKHFTTTYTLTVTAKNIVGSKKYFYSFDVRAVPVITATPTQEFKWKKTATGSETTTKIKGFNVTSWDIDDTVNGNDYLTSADLAAVGLKLKNGQITGIFTSPDTDKISFDKQQTIERKVRILANQNVKDRTPLQASRDITLKFTAAKPEFPSGEQARVETWSLNKLSYDVDLLDGTYYVRAQGPGKITWTVDEKNLPAGVTYHYDDLESNDLTSIDSYLVFTGHPEKTQKGAAVKITATNAAGSVTISPKFAVNFNVASFDFTDETKVSGDNSFSGIYGVGQNIDDASLEVDDAAQYMNADAGRKVFQVTAGPAKFTATGLPKGITLKQSDDTSAYLTGSFTKAQEQTKYTIKATLKNIDSAPAKEITGQIAVYAVPSIKESKVKDVIVGDNNFIEFTTKKQGNEAASTWEIKLGDVDSNDQYFAWEDGTKYLVGSADGTISGDLDRIPEGGTVAVRVAAINPAGRDTKTYTLKVIGKAAQFVDGLKENISGTTADGLTANVSIDGTPEINYSVYIDAKTAKNVFGASSAIYLPNDEDYDEDTNITGFAFISNDEGIEDPVAGGRIVYYPASGKSYPKGIDITVEASNAASKKAAKMVYKFTITGEAPKLFLVDSDDEHNDYTLANNETTTLKAIAGKKAGFYDELGELKDEEYSGYILRVSGDGPINVEFAGAANGLTITERDADNYANENSYKEYLIGGTPTEDKATKTKIKITAYNPSDKKTTTVKHTLLIQSQVGPNITTAAKDLKQEIEVGKKLALKLAAEGVKPIKWELAEDDNTDDDEYTEDNTATIAQDLLDNYGITFSRDAGTFTSSALTHVTLNDAETAVAAKNIYIRAKNAAGLSSTKTLKLTIKGTTPTIKTTLISFDRIDPDFEDGRLQVSTDISKYAGEEGSADITYSLSTSDLKKLNTDMGLALDDVVNGAQKFAEANGGPFSTPLKGTVLTFNADNYGNKTKGKVNFIIKDRAPDIDSADVYDMEASGTDKAKQEVQLSLTEDTKPTGKAKIKWEIVKADTQLTKGVTAKVKADKDTSSATLTVEVAKKATLDGVTTAQTQVLVVRATNQVSKVSDTETYRFSVTPYVADDNDVPEDYADLPEDAVDGDEEDGDEEDELARGEGDVILGETRTVAGLTGAERSAIEEAGYVIAAVLPEVTVTEDGFYDLDVVALAEEAPEGAELVWFAFPRDAAASDDDEIAEFYDEAGAETEVVPEGRQVVPAAWFNADVTYAPVIAVKVEKADDAKETLDDAEEGDVVTLEALESAE